MTRRNPKNKAVIRSAILGLLLVAVACSKQQPAAPAPPPPPPQPKPVVQKPVSSAKLPQPAVNQLDFSTKKDPFKPFVAVKVATPVDKRAVRPQLPIHSFDVSQFQLIGVVADPKGNKAMVVDPARKGYVLKIGMTIGKNEGKVVGIDTSGVDVVEQFRDENNKIRKETIRIPLLRKP